MSKLLRKPSALNAQEQPARFERFNLIENPFPSEPVVNKDSSDKRINGDIYEVEIRKKEYDQITNCFLKQPQSSPNHLRLGYIIDTSYIGRGNGKSAFLVNLQQDINKEYCLDISDGVNKCFAIYVTPEPGGRTKTFPSFVDLFFKAILDSNILKECLAILRLEAIRNVYPEAAPDETAQPEAELIENLNTKEWFEERHFDLAKISNNIFENKYFQNLPPDFPLFKGRNSLLGVFIRQSDIEIHYNNLKTGKPSLDFVFSQLIRVFQAAGFNGAYVLVDDFERIPDFQNPVSAEHFESLESARSRLQERKRH